MRYRIEKRTELNGHVIETRGELELNLTPQQELELGANIIAIMNGAVPIVATEENPQ